MLFRSMFRFSFSVPHSLQIAFCLIYRLKLKCHLSCAVDGSRPWQGLKERQWMWRTRWMRGRLGCSKCGSRLLSPTSPPLRSLQCHSCVCIKPFNFKPFDPVNKRTKITYREEASGRLKCVTRGVAGTIIELCLRFLWNSMPFPWHMRSLTAIITRLKPMGLSSSVTGLGDQLIIAKEASRWLLPWLL